MTAHQNNQIIAVVDDDAELGSLIADYLRKNGFDVQVFGSGETFLRMDFRVFSLLILDVGLPGMDGFSVCREIRQLSTLPIIMLTAASDDVDRILGLELGADDYMGKPFNPRELLARIKAALRRVQAPVTEPADGFVIRALDRSAHWHGHPIDLTSAEFDLLLLFETKRGEIVTRDDISRQLKGRAALPFDRSIDTLVSRLRRKCKDASGLDLIRSIRGRGYVFAR